MTATEKEGNPAICNNTGEPKGRYGSEISQNHKNKHYMALFICEILKIKLIEAEWGLPGAMVWGKWDNTGQGAQTVSHKMMKSWGYLVQHGDRGD